MSNNLYKISQDVNNKYDTYDSAVVVAENEEQAKLIHPNAFLTTNWPDKWDAQSWVEPNNVNATLIGVAVDNLKVGTVVCSSYNAG